MAVFTTEQDYHEFKDKNQIQRDVALNEFKVSMLGEGMRLAFAVSSDLLIERT